MDAEQGSSSAHTQAPAADDKERDTDSDSYNGLPQELRIAYSGSEKMAE